MAVAASYTYDLDGLAEYARQAARLLESISFVRPFKVAKILIASDIKENFAGQHGPDGQPWAPLKHRQGQALRDKGFLLAASTAELVETLDDYSLTLTNVLEYAALHNFGGTVHKDEQRRSKDEKPWVFTGPNGETIFTRRIKEHDVTVPARPFMGVSVKAADRIAEAFAEHVMNIL